MSSVLTVNQVKVTIIILVVTHINRKRRPVQECRAHYLDGDKEVNPAEDNAAADNPSSKALSAIVSTVSVNDDALLARRKARFTRYRREKRLARLGFHRPRISVDSKAVT